MNKKAVVLLSGGQDSTTCLFWAITKYGPGNVEALAIDYAQRHGNEVGQARKICQITGIPLRIVATGDVLLGSALVDPEIGVNDIHPTSPLLPATFTPARNAFFLCIAANHAVASGCSDIITGVCQTDFSGYPDCRAGFIRAMNFALVEGLGKSISIRTPLMGLTKAETWKLARSLSDLLPAYAGFSVIDIVRTMTLTDYNGDTTMNEWGMGREDNPASILRAKGYREAKENGWLD